MTSQTNSRRKRLGTILLLLFGLTLVMGPGPGMYLVNPDPNSPGPAPTALGLPVLYVWAVGWFFVQLAILVVAYRAIWSRREAAS